MDTHWKKWEVVIMSECKSATISSDIPILNSRQLSTKDSGILETKSWRGAIGEKIAACIVLVRPVLEYVPPAWKPSIVKRRLCQAGEGLKTSPRFGNGHSAHIWFANGLCRRGMPVPKIVRHLIWYRLSSPVNPLSTDRLGPAQYGVEKIGEQNMNDKKTRSYHMRPSTWIIVEFCKHHNS